jgi:hypothetical protein
MNSFLESSSTTLANYFAPKLASLKRNFSTKQNKGVDNHTRK